MVSVQMIYFAWKNNYFFMEGSFPVVSVYFLGQCGLHTSLNFIALPSPQHSSAVLCLCPH